MPDDGIIRIFVSYSHDDHAHFMAFKKALGLVTARPDVDLWSDHAIEPGSYWSETIERQLDDCDIFVPLLSGNFTGSTECRRELEWIERRHARQDVRVIPIYVSDAAVGDSFVAGIEALPAAKKRNRPVEAWKHRDKAWKQIAEHIHQLVNNMRVARNNLQPEMGDRRALDHAQETRSTAYGFRATNHNAIPTVAELLVEAGGSNDAHTLYFQPDIRLGRAEIEHGEKKLEIAFRSATLSLNAAGGEFLNGQGLGERPNPHRTESLEIERQAARIFKFSPVEGFDYLYGYIGEANCFCRVRIDDQPNFRIDAFINVELSEIDVTLYRYDKTSFEKVEVSENKQRLIDMIVAKGCGRDGNKLVVSKCSLEPET